MARTLKTTIGSLSNTNFKLLVCVDDDNTTIKDFSAAGVGVTNTGVTVTTAKTWKSVSVPMMTFLESTDILTMGATTPNVLSPCTIFMIVKDSSAADTVQLMYGSATAGGSADAAVDPFIVFGSNPSPKVTSGNAGSNISLPSVTLAAGDDWSCFWTSNTADPNQSWFSLEANALSTNGTTVPNFQFTSGPVTLNGFLKQIGSNTTPTWTCDLVMFGVIDTLINGTDAAAIHADPFGALFDAAAAVDSVCTVALM